GPQEPQPEKRAATREPAPAPEKPPEESEPGDGLKPPTAEEINRAIDRGVAWLKQAQKESGTWGPCVSGGFPYRHPHGPSRGMTAAGLSSLLICREQLGLVKEKEPAWIGDAIAKGLAYLDANFD